MPLGKYGRMLACRPSLRACLYDSGNEGEAYPSYALPGGAIPSCQVEKLCVLTWSLLMGGRYKVTCLCLIVTFQFQNVLSDLMHS